MDIKQIVNIKKALKSHAASDVILYVETIFKKHPDGFYIFIRPCSSSLYKNGESLSEKTGVSGAALIKIFQMICVFYPSKSIYWNRLELEEGISFNDPFEGLPYLRYFDRSNHMTFFRRNEKAVEDLMKGILVFPENLYKK